METENPNIPEVKQVWKDEKVEEGEKKSKKKKKGKKEKKKDKRARRICSTSIRLLLYALLIWVLVQALIVWISEPTAFEEIIAKEDAYYPSFTICPNDYGQHNDSFKTFEDVLAEIERVKQLLKGSLYMSLHFQDG